MVRSFQLLQAELVMRYYKAGIFLDFKRQKGEIPDNAEEPEVVLWVKGMITDTGPELTLTSRTYTQVLLFQIEDILVYQ